MTGFGGDPRFEIPMTEDILLKAEGLCKSFSMDTDHLDVLRSVDLEVRKGEILAVTGPSGVGKSTLLHILGALDRPTRGRVMMDSTDVFALSDERLASFRNRTIGFVFQFHHLLSDFTALENVMMPLLIEGQEREEAAEHAQAMLARVGLSARESHRPNELSGGEQQRVAVARALVSRPLVVLADEPAGNLDLANSKRLLDLVWELSSTLDQAFVIATHDMDLAGQATRRIRLSDGRIFEDEDDHTEPERNDVV